MNNHQNSISFWADVAQNEIDAFFATQQRHWMNTGQRYYRIDHDVLHQQRTVIGEGGRIEQATNMADNRLPHPFLHELIEQKIQYLLGKPYTIQAEQPLRGALEEYFDHNFFARLQSVTRDAVCCGIGWLHVYIDETGALQLLRCNPLQMIPVWRDEAHTDLEAMIRIYTTQVVAGKNKKYIEKVDVWTEQGVFYFERRSGKLIIDPEKMAHAHMYRKIAHDNQAMNWRRLPFIPVRYNDEAVPLIQSIKKLIDDYDRIVSD